MLRSRFKRLRNKKFFLLFRNLIIAEILLYIIFLGLALSADWGKIYEGSILANYIPFEVIEFTFLGFFQLGVILLVFYKSSTQEVSIGEIISSKEHEKLEFKTTFRWDVKRNQVNKDLEKTVMKTITAFMNSDGGCLLIGVDDSGNPTGLEQDLASLQKPNHDGFENHFNNIFNNMIGPEFRRSVNLKFNKIGDKTVCLVSVEPSLKPAYLKSSDNEDFYIRTGNVTTPLKMSEVAAYLSSWRRS